MQKHLITIGRKKIGAGQPVFIIAEAGVNHNGKLSLAKKLIDAAEEAGADAVKFQTFSADELVTKNAGKAGYQERNEEHPTSILPSKEGRRQTRESQYAMLKRLELPRAWHAELKKHAEKKGLVFLSTPFSLDDAQFLKRLGVAAVKVGSSDANNIPYLRQIALWGLPIILSTGMCTLREVQETVRTIQNPSPLGGTPFRKGRIKSTPLILMHCTTNYPTPFEEANLRAIQTLQKAFKVPVGFSDHTLGYEAACAAVALGASVMEKHITLDRNLPGPDHKASVEPEEFRNFVRHIRNTEAALGTGEKVPFKSEREIARAARKSIVTTAAVKKGERFTEDTLGIKRPGTGLPPKMYDSVIGERATRDIPADTLISKHDYTA